MLQDEVDVTRISPLRGNLSQEEIIEHTKNVKNGLSSLRDDHYHILAKIRDDYENNKNQTSPASLANGKLVPDHDLVEARIANVTASLEDLEVGIEESSAIISLYDHFQRLEADRTTLRLEMSRVLDENDWLRDELSETQKRLQDALAELSVLQDEKKQWEFQEELKNINENSIRPVTPSKIPVGSWRVEEEKDINRALAGLTDSTNCRKSTERSASPAPSKIPVGGWRNRLSVYKKVMEKQEELDKNASSSNSNMRGRQYFKLNATPKTPTKIPIR